MVFNPKRRTLTLGLVVALLFLYLASILSRTEKSEKSVNFPVSNERALEVPTPTPSPSIRQSASVVKIIDGDTINVSVDNKISSVRLIGIDAPEAHDPRKPIQCFAKEATIRLKKALDGKTVFLESDPTQGDLDKYKRLLRYIFLDDGTNINKMMISEGYAHEYTYNLPYKYRNEFKQAESDARAAKRGFWADKACAENV